MNEFKFSGLRQFGSENVSFTAIIHSEKVVLSQEEIDAQVNQFSAFMNKAFISVQESEISEKALLAEASDRRTAEVKKLDDALKEEMKSKKDVEQTMLEAERLDKKLKK